MLRTGSLLLLGALLGSLATPPRSSDVVRGWYEELHRRAASGELTRPLDGRPLLTAHVLLALAVRRGDADHALALAAQVPELDEREVLALARLLVTRERPDDAFALLARGLREGTDAELFLELARVAPGRGAGLLEELRSQGALTDDDYHDVAALLAWHAGEPESVARHLAELGRSDGAPRTVRWITPEGGGATVELRSDVAGLLERWGLVGAPPATPRDPWDLGHELLARGDGAGAAAAFRRGLAGAEWLDTDDPRWIDVVPGPALARARELARQDDDADAWGRLGDVALRLGRREEAERAYARALALESRDGYWSVVVARVRLGLAPHDRRDDWLALDALMEGPFGLEVD